MGMSCAVLWSSTSSFILLNTECCAFQFRQRREGHTTSNIDAKPSPWRGFSTPARFIILAQTLVIGFLSFWVYQEYLNNLYLRTYVNDQLQTVGWAFALAVIIMLGTVAIAVSRNRAIGKKAEPEELEAVSTEVEIPNPASPQMSAKPSTDLHPIVAQLKAELARTLMPIENVPVPKLEETTGSGGGQPSAVTDPTTLPTRRPPTPPAPATVIVGMVPVPKKEEKEAPAEDKSQTEEKSQPTG
ncbi:MAG: hypothetical protein AABX62_04020 [Thermoproteota archaeon]